jgi:prepilin-type N-terminal cleavage/methylation domain-containing protein
MKLQNRSYLRRKKRQDGFTLIEVLVVIIIIGVLASIAAPGWVGFLNQQRVNRANDVVLRALQSTQSEARKTKFSYSFMIRMGSNGVPELASFPDNDGNATPTNWQSLGADIGLSPNQVWAGTNFSGTNVGSGTPTAVTTTPAGRIRFDHTGVLRSSAKSLTSPLNITLGQFGSNPPNRGTMRCVQITTLLGSMETRREGDCITSP